MTRDDDMDMINRVIALADPARLDAFWQHYRFWRTNKEAYLDVLAIIQRKYSEAARRALSAGRMPDVPDTLNMLRRLSGLWQFYQQDTARYDPARHVPPTWNVGGFYDSSSMIHNFARRLMLDKTLHEYRDVLPAAPYSIIHVPGVDGHRLPATLRLEYAERLKRWEAAHADGRTGIDYCARLEVNWHYRRTLDAKQYPPCSLDSGLDPILDTFNWDVSHYQSSEDGGDLPGNWLAGWRLKFDDDAPVPMPVLAT